MLIFHCFYNRNADFGGLLEPQLQGLKIQVCNIVTALCSIYVFFFYSLEGIIARVQGQLGSRSVGRVWRSIYCFFIVFITEKVILEVQILIFHCFYNRSGDFGGPTRDFLLLVLANINYFDIFVIEMLILASTKSKS